VPNICSGCALSIGAGLYEELVFRLMAFAALSFLLLDTLRMRKRWAFPLIVASTAIVFALYHYLGSEPFSLPTFAFRSAAGVYFGVIFLCRGFGITAAAHIAYDIFVVAIPLWVAWCA